jgi:hypothetical protein
VFGLFPDDASAAQAADRIAAARPGWWVAATHTAGSQRRFPAAAARSMSRS